MDLFFSPAIYSAHPLRVPSLVEATWLVSSNRVVDITLKRRDPQVPVINEIAPDVSLTGEPSYSCIVMVKFTPWRLQEIMTLMCV